MNKNSNTYIIIYSTVMVVVVAILLAVAALSLQERQYQNELNEKKTNILQSLDAADQNFDEFVKAYVIENGQKSEASANEVFDMMKTNKDLKDSYAAGKLYLFAANDGRVVVPIVGAGLWGDIWGYIALENDMNTVSGIVMAHKGETPGLGAEIATPNHQALYKGKTIFEGDKFVGVTLRKGGAQDPAHEVDAISGGTKTSDGVTKMIKDCLNAYITVFKAQPAVECAAEATETECKTENVANNE